MVADIESTPKRQKMSATQCLDEVMRATSARQDEKKEKMDAEPRKPTSKDVPKKGPVAASFSVEWSRKQVLCRIGKKGAGQSMTLSFSAHGGVENAVEKARAWVAEKNGS